MSLHSTLAHTSPPYCPGVTSLSRENSPGADREVVPYETPPDSNETCLMKLHSASPGYIIRVLIELGPFKRLTLRQR